MSSISAKDAETMHDAFALLLGWVNKFARPKEVFTQRIAPSTPNRKPF